MDLDFGTLEQLHEIVFIYGELYNIINNVKI